MAVYKIIFKGEITNEGKRSKIEAALAKFFKIPVEKASVLFNGKSYALKKGLEVDDAIAMQQKFSVIGVVTHLVKEEVVIENITTQEPVDSKQNKEPVENNNTDSNESEDNPKVDDEWREKFDLAIRIEQGDMPEGFAEKAKLYAKNFNVWAGVFGIFYALYKKSWSVAFFYILFISLIDIFLFFKFDMVGKEQPLTLIYILYGVVFGHYFNRLHYFSLNGEKFKNHKWAGMVTRPKTVAVMSLTSFIVSTLLIVNSFIPSDPSGVWYSSRINKHITFNLEKKQIIFDEGMIFKVKSMSNAIFKDRITVMTYLEGGHKTSNRKWVITRKDNDFFDFEGSFNIDVEVFGEVIDDLEFVKEL